MIFRKGKELTMETKFVVEGIMCPNCVAKITGALKAVDGVKDVGVSEDYAVVTVLHDEGAGAEAMKAAIEGITARKFTVTGQV